MKDYKHSVVHYVTLQKLYRIPEIPNKCSQHLTVVLQYSL